MKRKIWVINFFAGTPLSGWGERHYYLAQEMLKDGAEVSIISSSYNHMFSQLAEAPKQFNYEEIDGVKFCWVKTPKYKATSLLRFWSMLVFTFKTLFLNSKRLGRPDVVLVSSMPIFPIISGFLLKHKFRAKELLFEIRDFWPLTPMLLGGYSKWHPMIQFIGLFERFGYRFSDKVISVLPGGEKHIEKFSHKEGRIFHVPNGINDNLAEIDQGVPDDVANLIPKDKFIIGYAGTIGLANAMDYVVDAAEMLRDNTDIHFVFVGDGYKKSELQKRSKDFGNITFVPRVRKDQVQGVLKLFDVALISWHKSPLYDLGVSANKFFDYMLAERPVLVAGNLYGNPIKLSNAGVVVEPESGKAIRDGVLELYEMSAEEREVLGQNGKRYVLKEHTFRNLAKKYLSIIDMSSK